ncbi:hypothetical protein [Nostoc favosum]|nr:hypothetical protein [Nostoc favosum]
MGSGELGDEGDEGDEEDEGAGEEELLTNAPFPIPYPNDFRYS